MGLSFATGYGTRMYESFVIYVSCKTHSRDSTDEPKLLPHDTAAVEQYILEWDEQLLFHINTQKLKRRVNKKMQLTKSAQSHAKQSAEPKQPSEPPKSQDSEAGPSGLHAKPDPKGKNNISVPDGAEDLLDQNSSDDETPDSEKEPSN
jgi:hypothetical protein